SVLSLSKHRAGIVYPGIVTAGIVTPGIVIAGIVTAGIVGPFQQVSPTQPPGIVGRGSSLAGISLAGMVRAGKWTGGTSTAGQQTSFALAAARHATVTEITAMVSVRFRVRLPITMRMTRSSDFYSWIARGGRPLDRRLR